jgi:transposase-like protein
MLEKLVTEYMISWENGEGMASLARRIGMPHATLYGRIENLRKRGVDLPPLEHKGSGLYNNLDAASLNKVVADHKLKMAYGKDK